MGLGVGYQPDAFAHFRLSLVTADEEGSSSGFKKYFFNLRPSKRFPASHFTQNFKAFIS
ncbi:hypothetical protein BT69DRAFT_1281976 [Atractiella rhizophila]|nr:hypothetical protein BT69DRAFT_1281976 [Atractiella rhizophila]